MSGAGTVLYDVLMHDSRIVRGTKMKSEGHQ